MLTLNEIRRRRGKVVEEPIEEPKFQEISVRPIDKVIERPIIEKRRPKVAIITPGLHMGGAERWSVDLAKWLDNRVEVIGLGVRHPLIYDELLLKASQQSIVYVGYKGVRSWQKKPIY